MPTNPPQTHVTAPSTSSSIGNGWKLLITILICEGVGLTSGWIGSAFNNPWFDALQKPSWNPPGFIFGPVGTTLYLLMAIALWLVWKCRSYEGSKEKAYWLFAFQLFLNFWWSILFFRFQSPELAFYDIVAMLIAIGLTIFQFQRITKPASWLMIPYFLWVAFATFLNYTIWQMNL